MSRREKGALGQPPERRAGRRISRKQFFALSLLACALLLILVGFGLGRLSRSVTAEFRDNPFWLDVSRVPKGEGFGMGKDMRRLPRSSRKFYSESARLARSGRRAEALEGFTKLLEERKSFMPAYGRAALLRIDFMDSARVGSGGPDSDSARALYLTQMGLGLNPEHPWMRYVAGRFWERAGFCDSALAHYGRAASLSPRFAYPYIGMGRCQLAAGETGAAGKSFKTALALMETWPKAYRDDKGEDPSGVPLTETAPFDYLALLYYQVGADDSARLAVEYGRERGSRSDVMSLAQGLLWESRGFLARADSVYRTLTARHPGDPRYAEALATLGWKAPRPSALGSHNGGSAEAAFAISLLDPLVRKHPGDLPLRMALGQAYYHRGLFGLAAESFDSCLALDPTEPGLKEARNLAFEAWARENVKARAAQAEHQEAERRSDAPTLPADQQTPVIVPGSMALLGTYTVPWGCSPGEVFRAYPRKAFRLLPNGDLLDAFVQDGIKHEYLLAFREGKLWGIRVLVTDSAGVAGDLFGRLIRVKSKISGEGKGTGEASCPGYLPFQGVIWENDDTFEFMAQFQGKENQVRLARVGREFLSENRRLCDYVSLLKAETWK